MKRRELKEEIDRLLADFTQDPKAIGARAMEELDYMPEEKDRALPLLDTIRTISSVIQSKQPSQDFVDRLSQAVQKRFQEQISAEKMQRIIGMAVTVESFRKSLFADVIAACRSVGIELTMKEAAALRNLKEESIEEFANSLDERITKFFPTNLP